MTDGRRIGLDRLNACGAGAIAAMLAACRERGATTGRVLAPPALEPVKSYPLRIEQGAVAIEI